MKKKFFPSKYFSTSTHLQPVTFPGCSALRTSLSVAVLRLSAASLPSSPTPAVAFTHLPNTHTHRGKNRPETFINLALMNVQSWTCPGTPPQRDDLEASRPNQLETRFFFFNPPPFLGAGAGLVRSGPDQLRHTVSYSVRQPLDFVLVGQLGLHCCGSSFLTRLVHCTDR